MEIVRINVRRLATLVLASLIAPLAIALVLDMALHWMPWLTLGTALIVIPLSTVIVIRATLAELESVIRVVAPLEPEHPEPHSS